MTTATTTLTDFLLARIAEDEHWATECAKGFSATAVPDSALDHIENWAPNRVLAECEAKRRIVEIHEFANADKGGGVGCMHCDWDREWGMPTTGGCDTVRFLSLPYADHPDYRDEWRP